MTTLLHDEVRAILQPDVRPVTTMTDDETPWRSTEILAAADRPAAWAAMAIDLAAQGRTHPEIADALCVDAPTVEALLDWGPA